MESDRGHIIWSWHPWHQHQGPRGVGHVPPGALGDHPQGQMEYQLIRCSPQIQYILSDGTWHQTIFPSIGPYSQTIFPTNPVRSSGFPLVYNTVTLYSNNIRLQCVFWIIILVSFLRFLCRKFWAAPCRAFWPLPKSPFWWRPKAKCPWSVILVSLCLALLTEVGLAVPRQETLPESLKTA